MWYEEVTSLSFYVCGGKTLLIKVQHEVHLDGIEMSVIRWRCEFTLE